MAPYYTDDSVTLYHGDCLDILRELPDASIDAVVTDPPYGLEFMGKGWDRFDEDSKARAGMTGTGYTDGAQRLERPSFLGGLNPKCRSCGQWQRGGNPCTCDTPDFPNERRARSAAFGDWCFEWATECRRVLKPGGHMLAFGGTRTWHRLACAVEDAGFEIRDSIAWLYGSGFSKSWNFKTQFHGDWCRCRGTKALPYNHASNTDLHGVRDHVHPSSVARGKNEGTDLFSEVQRGEPWPGLGPARAQGTGSLVGGSRGVGAREDERRQEPGVGGWGVSGTGQGLPDDSDAQSPAGKGQRVRGRAPAGDGDTDRATSGAARGSASHQRGSRGQPAREPETLSRPHEPLDDGALRDGPVCARCGGLDPAYEGFGTGLKPAFEPIVVARKPLSGTVAATVLEHGTGALNIDATRVQGGSRPLIVSKTDDSMGIYGDGLNGSSHGGSTTAGRWPPNVILDESQADALDAQSGASVSRSGGVAGWQDEYVGGKYTPIARTGHDDSGGASRFFPTFHYEPKAPTHERPRDGDTAHPTVKPLDLMRWLIRLVTPPGGTVLDPFAGSGTTAEACVVEHFRCITIERDETYLPLIVARLTKPIQVGLNFDAMTTYAADTSPRTGELWRS